LLYISQLPLLYNKIPEKITLQEERLIWAHGFQRFACFWTYGEDFMAEELGGAKLSPHGKQELARGNARAWKVPPPKFPPPNNAINGLIHR
jgi:hypothetical protein